MSTLTSVVTTTQTPNRIFATREASVPRGPVQATLNFFAAPSDGSPPFNYVESPPAGQPQRNFGDTEVSTTVQDIRDKESAFDIDNNAFQALLKVGDDSGTDFYDDASIKQHYYPEVERLLLDHVPGAKRILFFDHTVRRADPESKRAPVTRVHIDQTPTSAQARVRFHLPEEADALLQDRFRIINVWRPINGAVESFPLGFADSQTVDDDALVGIQHRYPDRTGETAAVKPGAGQQWYYWSGMQNSERLLLQCYDSEKGARVPHTAFVDPRSPAGSKPRESIEVRALVFG